MKKLVAAMLLLTLVLTSTINIAEPSKKAVVHNADGTVTMSEEDAVMLITQIEKLQSENSKLANLAYSLMQALDKIRNPHCI
jgi:hypothetical protein